jgi:ABC-2 type transport system ATP-binding protein
MTAVLEATGLHKRFGKLVAVEEVSLHLAQGEVLAFLGPNGAGKTTTIKMLAGLLFPDQGQVRLMGKDPHRDPWALRHLGAVLEGNRNVYWRMTAQENLVYFGVARGLRFAEASRRAQNILEQLGLVEKSRTEVRHLSRGMQQKLSLGVALMHHPELLLLDEPTLGLDVESALRVEEMVRGLAREGKAILLTTHQLEVAQRLASRLAIIQRGKILLEGRTTEVLGRFAGEHYVVELETPLPPERLASLRALGLEGEGPSYVYHGDGEGLWRLLEALKPWPLKKVARAETDLLEVFLKVVGRA